MRPAYVRWPLLVILLIGVFFLYRNNFEKRFERIEASTSFWDETKTWSETDRRILGSRIKLFRDDLGIKVLTHVRNDQLELPKLTGTTLFIGMAPEHGKAMLVLPGLAAQIVQAEGRAQGKDIRLELEENLALCLRTQANSAMCAVSLLDELARIFLTGSK